MIYIPIELQLQWIREDLEYIKKSMSSFPETATPEITQGAILFSHEDKTYCLYCSEAQRMGLASCRLHQPEYGMRINIECP